VPYGAAANPATIGQKAYGAMSAESDDLLEAAARKRRGDPGRIGTDAKVAFALTTGALVLMVLAAVLAR